MKKETKVELPWLRPEAPYMPVVSAGLLSALADAGEAATSSWSSSPRGPILSVHSGLEVDEIAEAVFEAPWPDATRIPWGTKLGQAIKPMLATADDPVGELLRLRTEVAGPDLLAERRLLGSLVTDAALDDAGVPGRNRLLRGVKSDLSGIREKVKLVREELVDEISYGPIWRSGKSGRGLGLVPEAQTFGGTTGRDPSQIGSHSVLLYRLLWLGILALPPVGVLRGNRRVVGGPLITDLERISWPVWATPLGLQELKTVFCLSAIHSEEPDHHFLRGRGIEAVYRAPSVPINSMISVFRWGRRVA